MEYNSVTTLSFDSDDFCRSCGGHRGEGKSNCWSCDGAGGRRFGLSMQEEQAERDIMRSQMQAEWEAKKYADGLPSNTIDDDELEAIAKWADILKEPPSLVASTRHGDAYFQAIMECNRLGKRPYPKWEDFAGATP